ncbi:MAG: diaminopimelate epimerase [Synergistales bacterium]|nr:diaminopimelate epimerase [Synergistales bacterium]
MELTKMEGNGNDFLVLDNRRERYDREALSGIAATLCRRRSSLGADGLLVLEEAQGRHFGMRLFNADGSEGEMCGNGARCLARYAWERGIAPAAMSFVTLAGPVRAWVGGGEVTLDMGRLRPDAVVLDGTLSVMGREIVYCHLTVGVPHTVLFFEAMEGPPGGNGREALAQAIQNDKQHFPEGTNVNFAAVTDAGLSVATFERGVNDFTRSCGTGSTAAAVAAYLKGMTGSPTDVTNPGGVNRVTIEHRDDELLLSLTGPARFVAECAVTSDPPL